MDSWSLLISAVRAFGILKAIDFLKRDRITTYSIESFNFYFKSVISGYLVWRLQHTVMHFRHLLQCVLKDLDICLILRNRKYSCLIDDFSLFFSPPLSFNNLINKFLDYDNKGCKMGTFNVPFICMLSQGVLSNQFPF